MLSTLLALTLISPLAVSSVGGDPDPARLLPADTLIYFGSTSVQAGFEASRGTAMAQILSEPEVKAFLSEPLNAANQVISAGLGMLKGEIGEAQQAASELGLGIDMALDENQAFISLDTGTPPPLGQTFFALTHIDMPTNVAPGVPPIPELGLVIGVEVLGQDMGDMLTALWSNIPFPDANGSHGGVDYLAKTSPFGTVCLAVLDQLVVVATTTDDLFSVIDRWHGEAADGSSLAQDSDYRAMINAAGGLPLGGSSYFVHPAPLFDFGRMGLMLGLSQTGEVSPEEQGQILDLFDSIGFGALHTAGGVSVVGSDGLVYGTTVVSVDEGSPGLLAQLAKPGSALEVSSFKDVPGDCLSASLISLGTQMGDLYDFVFDALRRIEPDAVQEAEQALAALLGEYSLRDDLLGNIQGRVLIYQVPGQGMMGTPDTVIRLDLNDAERFVGALGSLLDAASGEIGMPVSLKPAEHEGHSYYRLDLSATPAGMVMQPALVAADGELLFCSSERQLKSILNGAGASSNPLWNANDDLRTFATGLATQGEVNAVGFSDLQASFGTSYQSFAGMAAMVPGLSDLPVDMSKLPAEGTLGRHLRQSFSGSYRTPEGLEVSRTISQFQLGDFLPIALIAGAIWAGQEMGLSTEVEAAAIDPSEQARNDLRELKASITVYKISEGGYPDSLDDLLRPLADFPGGSYQHDSLPLDPWGQPYRFAMEKHPTKGRLLPKLWSLGPNGQDEGGAGDDILKF